MRVVDALGTWCPVPVLLAARAIAAVAPGDAVELLADDPMVEVDLPAWCHDTGHELVTLQAEPGGYRGIIRRRMA